MFKKFLTSTAYLMLTVMLALMPVMPVAAMPAGEPPNPTAVVWSPSTGRQAHIPVRQQSSLLSDGSFLTVFEAEVTPAVLASLVKSDQAWDSSLAVKVTIWMYYNKFYYNGRPWVSVNKYSTMWQRYDSSVSMSGAHLNAGCFGESWDGYPEECLPNQYQEWWIGTPSPGAIYTGYPRWRGHYIEIVDISYQAGSSTVTLKRGAATWYLSICIWEGSCAIQV